MSQNKCLENWESFRNRCEDNMSDNIGGQYLAKLDAVRVELLGDGDSLPGPIVARRGNCYLCQTEKEPRDEGDFTISYIVPGPYLPKCVVPGLHCSRNGPDENCWAHYDEDSEWNCRCAHQRKA